ncbi:MAG TPA: hypothetical protein HA346_01225 [Thermoplasmata archaeon]|nr:hypothetical protein [Thermoplasmata archaeon]
MRRTLKIRCVFTAPTVKVGMAGGFTPVAEWGWARNEEEILGEVRNVKKELKKIEDRFDGEVRFEGWDILHNEEEVLARSFEIQNSEVSAVVVFGFAVTVPYTHAFLTFNKPLIIFAKEFSKPFYGSNLENAFLAWKFKYENKSHWVSIVTDSFDWLSKKINAIRAISKMKKTKVLCVGPVHQLIGGKPLGIGSYECIREAEERLGLEVEFISLEEFIDEFNKTEINSKMEETYRGFLSKAKGKRPEVKDDEALRAVKCYFILKNMIARTNSDALMINCYQSNLIDRLAAAPCFGVARLNDEGVVAGCEADPNGFVNMLIVSYTSNKPVFMGDPIFNEKNSRVINAHCLCASKLKGFNEECEPYLASIHYESGRSLSQQTTWEKGRKITGTLLSPTLDTMIIIKGVVTNSDMGYPACTTQVEFEMAGIDELWKQCGRHIPFIGHLVTVEGDHSEEIAEVCKLTGIEPIVV